MTPKIQSLDSTEKQVVEQLGPHLLEHQVLATDAFNLIGTLLAQVPEAPMNTLPKALHVAVKLMLRLSNDLRSVQILTSTGYPIQALAIAASMCEVAFTVAWIGADETRAQVWLDHDDPTRSLRDFRTMMRDALAALGIPDPEAQTQVEYRVYRQLCWAKHANPILEKRFGIEVSADKVISANGPDASEAAVRAAWFALEHGAAFAFIAATSFFNSHAQTYCPREVATQLLAFVEHVGAGRKKLEAVAMARWGKDDPFPGRW